MQDIFTALDATGACRVLEVASGRNFPHPDPYWFSAKPLSSGLVPDARGRIRFITLREFCRWPVERSRMRADEQVMKSMPDPG